MKFQALQLADASKQMTLHDPTPSAFFELDGRWFLFWGLLAASVPAGLPIFVSGWDASRLLLQTMRYTYVGQGSRPATIRSCGLHATESESLVSCCHYALIFVRHQSNQVLNVGKAPWLQSCSRTTPGILVMSMRTIPRPAKFELFSGMFESVLSRFHRCTVVLLSEEPEAPPTPREVPTDALSTRARARRHPRSYERDSDTSSRPGRRNRY